MCNFEEKLQLFKIPQSAVSSSLFFTHSSPALSLRKSFGWPWHPADSLVLLGLFHPVCFSHTPLSSQILFFHPSTLPLWSPAVKEIQILFERRTPRSDVICKKKKKNWRVCFTFRLENSVIAREVLSHDKCSINPSWALQGFKMIRGEFLLSTFGFFFFLICSFFSFYFLVLSFVLILSRVLFHCVSSTTGN